MDPLEALRSAISKKRKLEWKDGNIFIDQHVFPGKTVTCMKKHHSHDSHKEAKEASYYTLDSIFFFWKTFSQDSTMEQGNYALLCVDNNVDAVSLAQHDALLNYLNGTKDTCTYMDTSASFRYVKPQFAAALSKSTGEKSEGDASSQGVNSIQAYKRIRTILGNEKLYETRSKIINLNGRTKFTEAVLFFLNPSPTDPHAIARREVLRPSQQRGLAEPNACALSTGRND